MAIIDGMLQELEMEAQTTRRVLERWAAQQLLGSTPELVETAVDRAGLEKLWAVRRLASPALARRR